MPVKVAKYLKIPYAYNLLNLFGLGMQCKPYKSVHDGLYYTKACDYRTYFYCKNDLITYARKSNYEVVIFKYNLLKGVHVLLKFSNLKGIIRDEDTFWISVNEQIKFIVSRDTELQNQKRYITITNISNGHLLLKASKDKEVYLEFLPIFSDIILPIIQAKKDGVHIHLVDLLRENSYIMSWYLDDIKILINAAVKADEALSSYETVRNTMLQDNVNYIRAIEFDINSIYGHTVEDDSNDEDDKSDNRTKTLTVTFGIKVESDKYNYDLKSLAINIEFDKDKITGILKFNRNGSKIQIAQKSSKENSVYSINSNNTALSSLPYINTLTRTQKLSKMANDKISKYTFKVHKDIIYSDGLYHLIRHAKGIEVRKISEYGKYNYTYNLSSVHRYKQYIFLFNRFPDSKLFIIDTKNNLIVIISASVSNFRILTEYKMHYYFYPLEKHQK